MKSVLGELQIVVEKHSDVLRNNALPFRVLVAFRLLGFVLSWSGALFNLLGLIPIQLFSIELWRIVTSAFIGRNVFILTWTMFSLHWGTNLVRQAHSNQALLRVYVITQVVANIAVCLVSILLYTLSGKTTLLYETPLVDLVPVNAAVLVLIKQFLPDSIVLTTPIGRVKYTHLPGVGILATGLGALLGISTIGCWLQCLLAVQVSWTYLRFFDPHETDDVYGDGSEHFTWASLWPRRVQPMCTVLGRVVFRSLVKFGVCKRQVRHVDLDSLQSVSISLPGLDSTARDAERRRQKALRDLNERLNKTRQVENAVNWDEDEETKADEPLIKDQEEKLGEEVETSAVDIQPSRSEETHVPTVSS